MLSDIIALVALAVSVASVLFSMRTTRHQRDVEYAQRKQEARQLNLEADTIEWRCLSELQRLERLSRNRGDTSSGKARALLKEMGEMSGKMDERLAAMPVSSDRAARLELEQVLEIQRARLAKAKKNEEKTRELVRRLGEQGNKDDRETGSPSGA